MSISSIAPGPEPAVAVSTPPTLGGARSSGMDRVSLFLFLLLQIGILGCGMDLNRWVHLRRKER